MAMDSEELRKALSDLEKEWLTAYADYAELKERVTRLGRQLHEWKRKVREVRKVFNV